MDLGLQGKLAFVVGASAGIGAATARHLAAEGARLVLMARGAEALTQLRDALRAAGHQADCVTVDLRDGASVAAVMAQAMAEFGVPDSCVISAGDAQGGVMWELPDALWQDALELKFMGMVRVMRALAPAMQARGSGRIVAVVGNNGRQPHARMLPGSAANAACLAVVRGLAEELAPSGVGIVAVNPGPTATGRWTKLLATRAAREGRPEAEIAAEVQSGLPRGRLAEADEVGALCAVLCSDLADMVTGTSLTIDGGATRALA